MSRSSAFPKALLTQRGILRHLPGIALCSMLAGLSAQPLFAATTTTTALAVSPSTLAPGQPAKLVATVTDTSNNLVFPGTVTFYDGTRLLGSAQLVTKAGGSFAQGTATLNIASFDRGANSITAAFAGTTSYLSSASQAQTLTVTGQYSTTTTLAVSGLPNDYGMTATVNAFGIEAPTGSVEFLNDTTDTSLGSLALSGTTPISGFVIGSTQAGIPNYTFGLAAGDFNGDGLLDAAVVTDFQAVGVYPGKGDGTFSAPNLYYYGLAYQTLIPGDFNNDGKLDLIAIIGYEAVLYLGNGDGTLQAPIEFGRDFDGSTGCFLRDGEGAVADFDRDGNLDLVVTGSSDDYHGNVNYVCLFRGNGDGTFKPAQNLDAYSLENGRYSIVAGDLNGDKIPDIVFGAGHGKEEVRLGNGDGTFKPPAYYSLGDGPHLALSDFNGDGNLDLAVTNSGSNTVTVALGKGDGSFGPPTSYPAGGNYPFSLVTLDINRDGKPDILVSGASNYDIGSPLSLKPLPRELEPITVLLGNGDGTFQPGVDYFSFRQYTDTVITGDFNGDGLPDILIDTDPNLGTQVEPSSALLLGEKSSSVTLSGVSLPGPGTTSVYAQYSGDGSYTPSTSCDISPGVTPASPAVTSVYSNHITSTTAAVAWTTNSPTNGDVSYGTTSSLDQSSPWDHNATTFHFVTLTGLTPATTYYFTVTSVAYFAGCDHWTTTSQVQTFTTAP